MRETQNTLEKEEQAIKRYVEVIGGEVFKSSDFDHYDYLHVNEDREKTFIEIKVRNVAHDLFYDTPVDYSKLIFLSAQPIKAILLVQWTDALGCIPIAANYKVDWFERNAGDREGDMRRLHAFYLNKDFTLI